MAKVNTFILYIVGLFLITSLALWGLSITQKADAAVPAFNEYQATSTAANKLFGAQTADSLLKTGQGGLGSVTITGANTGIVNFYNATTTNVNLRTGQKATSTILIASFPASAAAGTYVFDVQFTDGLYLDLDSGAMPTTTVTWR